jgi:hypothetical protein
MRNKNNMFFFQNLKINSKIILKINLFYISVLFFQPNLCSSYPHSFLSQVGNKILAKR